MAGLVDPTVTGNYPVILGDGLLGKTSNDIFTGIRYNHKPEHSSSSAPEQARLKPAIAGKTTSYDLSYNDNGTYAYSGTRNTDSNQYVLHFDPKRKAFILDRIDSTFNMNITRTPTNSDPDSLRQKYPHIEEELKAKPKPAPAPAPKAKASKARAKTSNVFNKPPPKPARKAEKKKDVPLSLPKPKATPAPEPKRKPRRDEDDEDEEEDEGPDPLEVDWGSPKANKADFSPAFNAVAPRRFDEYMNQRDSEAGEADEDSEGALENGFPQLPSPVKSRTAQPQPDTHDAMEVDDRRQDEDDDMAGSLEEDELEKELENAFELENFENSQNGTPDAGDESEISEED